ncbi:hypothetical protein EDD16DRAFT_1702627 [Pisolithus croceorrhizus]|nr:hypothetical protein EDD16DRAFT_1702627 [Pisolithus croceorrhizus]KAI6167610.1 hypothetical protein EDD17DRAFT_1750966 [Pisolithus thermaeus]
MSIIAPAAPGAPAQVLYEPWANLGKEPTKVDPSRRVKLTYLNAAPRADVLEHLIQAFKEDFDVRLSFGAQEVESYAISAFIELVKLNESAFRPPVRRLHD